MKFKVSSSLLYERLQVATKFIPAKPAIPVYGYYLFAVEGNVLTVTASDADVSLSTKLDIENQAGDGRVAIQSNVINDVIREMHEQPLEFDIDDHNYSVVMTSDSGKYTFMGQNTADYAEFAGLNADGVNAFKLSSSVLTDAISKTAFAVANDEIHPIMNGICFHFLENGGLNIVATDGHRMSKVTLSMNPGIQEGFVLPQKSANLLKGVLSKEVGDVDITFDKKFLVFQASSYTMSARQIEGVYPKYDSVIPKECGISVIVNREQLISALRRIQVCSNHGSNLIMLSLSSNKLQIKGQDIDFATSGEETIACSYEGELFEIGFKSTLVIEMLSNCDCADVEIRLKDQSTPGLYVPVQQKEGMEVLMLAMPMMLN